MLAQTAESPGEALARVGAAAVEWKLDGARVQVHRRGDEVRAFTRNLADITDRVPEVVEAVLALPVDAVVLDGEAIALRPDGRPAAVPGDDEPLREPARRRRCARRCRSRPFFFDCLHLDGEDLLDLPLAERSRVARRARSGGDAPARRSRPTDADEAERFLDDALARGHEGVMVKALAAPYEAGGAAPAGSRSSPSTRSTSSCSPPSGVTGAARAGSRTSTSARATPRPAAS